MNNDPIVMLAVNQPYPIKVNEGLIANFLSDEKNLLIVGFDGITDDLLLNFKKAPRVGILVVQPVILFIFDFQNVAIFDAPFDVRRISREMVKLPNIDNKNKRLLIEMHLVDSKTNILKAIRQFTLTPELTIDFLSAVQDQMCMPYVERNVVAIMNELYKLSNADLLNRAKVCHAGN